MTPIERLENNLKQLKELNESMNEILNALKGESSNKGLLMEERECIFPNTNCTCPHCRYR